MRTLTFINAQISGSTHSSLRIHGTRIASIGERPEPEDTVVDLKGGRVLPGLINAHDHLQLNHFPRLRYRDSYRNASEWIADIEPRLSSDSVITSVRAVPREERLFLGGIKNLLSGVTCVAHHDPLYGALQDEGFPTGIVHEYGWSHSLLLDGPQGVQRSHRQTPSRQPWIIHAGEGFDADARGEFAQLKELRCIGSNTVLVHAVALTAAEQRALADAGGSVVWCPSSNLFLLRRTLEPRQLLARHALALGSDSRLSGCGDLLDELRVAKASADLDDAQLEALVTCEAARVLKLADRGVLRPGAIADVIVLPAGKALVDATRSDMRLVLCAGWPKYGDVDLSHLAEPSHPAIVSVDGRPKFLDSLVAGKLRECAIQERGVTWRLPNGDLSQLGIRAVS